MAEKIMWFCIFALVYVELIMCVSSGFLSNVFGFVKDNSYCAFNECCTEHYIPFNVSGLAHHFKHHIYGQPLVMNIIPILEAHKLLVHKVLNHGDDGVKGVQGKALAMSFHGWPGNGKNYVSDFIVNALYKKGHKSKYVKFYSAAHDFPHSGSIYEYKTRLKTEILSTLSKCGVSTFIFDEVEKMPPGILESIKPIIDHHNNLDGIILRNAIFIFLSNYAGEDISMRMLELYEMGQTRNEIKMSDFEQVIRKASYIDDGGFQKSTVISGQLIDHYIPFLPMEAAHVKLCALAEFQYQGVWHPTEDMIAEAMAVITYGPTKNAPIFANAGCKRIKKQVAFVIQVQQKRKMLLDNNKKPSDEL